MGKLDYSPSTARHLKHTILPHARTRTSNDHAITISTLNVQTLRTSEREEELDHALKEIKFDVLGLSEIRRTGEAIIEKQNGDLFYYIGTTPGQRGVGFIIRKQVKHMVQEIVGVSERIAVLKLATRGSTITIIQVYAPTEAYSDETIEQFYWNLGTTIDQHKSTLNLIIGDFNSKVGPRSHEDEDPVGRYGYGARNERGEKLVQFAQEHKLKIANTFFKKMPSSKWTWRSPDGNTKNEIDYILSDNQRTIRDIQVVANLKFSTDHRMVRAKMKIERRRKHPAKQHRQNIENIDSNKFQLHLRDRIAESNPNREAGAQELYNSLEQCILQATKDSSKNTKAQKEGKLSQGTIALIERRSEMLQTRDASESNRTEYAAMDKLTKKEIRKDLREYRTTITRQIIETSKSIRKAKRERNGDKQWMLGIKNQAGGRNTLRTDIIQSATDFYKSLYTSSLTTQATNHIGIFDAKLENHADTFPPVLASEIRTAIDEMKNGKTPGEDGIYNELLKLASDQILPSLTNIFNKILQTEEIPEQWKSSTIILLHKKGTKDDMNNYRPISLMSNLYKLFSKVLTRRLTKVLDENQPTEQAGFRSGFSTTDHLQAINQIIEKTVEYHHTLYLAFVDYNKAFDSVEHSSVLQALHTQGIEHKYIRVLDKIYSQSYAKVKTEIVGQPFSLKRGVRQGDPISPKLFTCVLEDIFRKLNWNKKYGVNINGSRLSNLRFADDVVLFARSPKQLQSMLQELSETSKIAGLSMNKSKTQIMSNGPENPIKVDGMDLQYVSEYIYLGQLLSFHQKVEKEISRRIALAWKAFWSLKFILLDKSLNRKLKMETLQTCVLPTLLYGCQTWNLTAKLKYTLQVCQRKMERKILGITLKDRISNTTLQAISSTTDPAQQAIRKKWKWGGHVARIQDDRWTIKTTMWDPYTGKRQRGRPRRRWADIFKERAGAQWSRVARCRKSWRTMESQLCIN